MRPFGALFSGLIDDRMGRRTVLVASVALMGPATTAIGLLPNFRMVGLWAPARLLLVRLFQGFPVSGDFTGSVSCLIETAPANRRGYAGSFANIGSTGGCLLAAAMAAVTMALIHNHLSWSWAWWIPFLGAGLLPCLPCGYVGTCRSRPTNRIHPRRRILRLCSRPFARARVFLCSSCCYLGLWRRHPCGTRGGITEWHKPAATYALLIAFGGFL